MFEQESALIGDGLFKFAAWAFVFMSFSERRTTAEREDLV
jgi:hypothetical protein